VRSIVRVESIKVTSEKWGIASFLKRGAIIWTVFAHYSGACAMDCSTSGTMK
jgi:hypothetical protein